MADFDKSKMKDLGKESHGNDKKFYNVHAYTYDNGAPKISIRIKAKNSNPNADPKKTWISQKGISGMTKEEALGLAKALEKVAHQYL